MSDLPPLSDLPPRHPVYTPAGPGTPSTAVLSDAVEARARLCFRVLSLCLAASVLVLLAMSLHAVIGAFVDHARLQALESPHAVPADLVVPDEELADRATPSQAWPHAIVAVISVLMVGEVVLAIGLIRATFAMKVNTDVSATPEKESPPASSGLPGIELLKAAADTIKMVLEGLPKR